MVNAFPLDYLHVVCLGVMKKLLRMWISGDTSSLMPSIVINKISSKLLLVSSSQPSCFQRKIRPLSEFGYFKGTELRTFLLYAGPFVLKDCLPPEMYTNFLLLHVAITILCDKSKHKTHSNLAHGLILRFIENFGEIYGNHNIIYNVHCLTHLVNDTKIFGCLDNFSAFEFESFMSQIKRMLHKHNQPLPQLYNRIQEMQISGY